MTKMSFKYNNFKGYKLILIIYDFDFINHELINNILLSFLDFL